MERFWKVFSFIMISMFAGLMFFTEQTLADDSAVVDEHASASFRVDNARTGQGNRNSLRAKFVIPDAILSTNPRCPSATRVETYPWSSYPASSYNLDCENWRITNNGFQYKSQKNDSISGGVYSVRMRNTRKGLEVSVRASGAQYFSGVNIYTY